MCVDDSLVEITICMGSSCFARGNAENLEILKRYSKNKDSRIRIHIKGCLCQENCKHGPNLTINGSIYHALTAQELTALLHQISEQGASHGCN